MNEVYPLKKNMGIPGNHGLYIPGHGLMLWESWQNHPQKKPAPAGELHAFGDVFWLVVSQKH